MPNELSREAYSVLDEIQTRHPEWRAGSGDRDDFSSWFSSSTGLRGEAAKLDGVPVEGLIDTARQLQRKSFQDRDIWRIYVAKEPDHCFEALTLEAAKGHWPEDFWNGFFWEAFAISEEHAFNDNLYKKLFDLFRTAPAQIQETWALSLAFKFGRHHERSTILNEAQKLSIWDWLWGLASKARLDADQQASENTVNNAINEPGGVLCECIIDIIRAQARKWGEGIPDRLRRRLELVISSSGTQASFGRVIIGYWCQFLFGLAPGWSERNVLPLFDRSNPESAGILDAYHHRGQLGPAELFAKLKPHILGAFESRAWRDGARANLAEHLAFAVMSRYEGDEPWEISASEAKRAMRLAEPHLRHTAAWFLWRQLEGTDRNQREVYWKETIRPTFKDLWPVDLDCQDGQSSYRLAEMALSAEEEFPDALSIVEPFLVSQTDDHHGSILYRLHEESPHQIDKFPVECLKLLSLLIGSDIQYYPHQLREVLDRLAKADPTISGKPEWRRLDTLAPSPPL